MKARVLGLVLLLVTFAFGVLGALVSRAQLEPVDLTDVAQRGRAATEWFFDGEFDRVVALGLTEAMAGAMRNGEQLPALQKQIVGIFGRELELLDESLTEADGLHVYLRTARFERSDRVEVQWSFDDELRVAGFFVRPAPGAASGLEPAGLAAVVR